MPLRRKLLWISLLYFAEGLPFGIVKEVVPVYFKVSGVSLTDIGLASLLGLPWTLKVFWSPLVDRFGERRQWITGCLVTLAIFTALIPYFDPSVPTIALWGILLAITVASATQDVAIDAYTIGLVERGEEGDANGVRVSAYRVALIASGGALVLLAPMIGWTTVYTIGAALFAVLAIATWGAPRIVVPVAERRQWLEPMKRWLLRPGAWAVFLFVLIYKLGDATMGPMIKPFWIDRGLTVGEIGVVSTSVGVMATIAGALIGGRLTSRWGILRALLVMGLAQALSNLGYAAVGLLDPPLPQTQVASFGEAIAAIGEPGRGLIYAASMLESFTSGLGSAAFLAFLMHVCEKEHAAVQYAALSAVFALSRDVAGAISGYATTHLGYAPYFVLTFFLAFPALALLPIVRSWIHDRDPAPPQTQPIAAA
jgi:MFS transporter, PAT family, beta-lactamase induction signal transducer AmpG